MEMTQTVADALTAALCDCGLTVAEAEEYLRDYGPDLLDALVGAVRQYRSDLLTALSDADERTTP